MKSEWNVPNRSMTRSISSSGGKNVVRKCQLPSAWVGTNGTPQKTPFGQIDQNTKRVSE